MPRPFATTLPLMAVGFLAGAFLVAPHARARPAEPAMAEQTAPPSKPPSDEAGEEDGDMSMAVQSAERAAPTASAAPGVKDRTPTTRTLHP